MATLRNVSTGQPFKLRGRCLVGRSQVADLRLLAKGSSNEHATISWDGAQWTLRDLTSRNGTRINDVLLVSQSWRLTVGDELVFGDPEERWAWVDSAPPSAMALCSDGRLIEAEDELLLLPDETAPHASVNLRDGHWEIEVDGQARVVVDGDTLELGGRRFVLQLPSPDPASQLTRTVQRRCASAAATIRFRPSLNEEHVAIGIEAASITRELPARAFNYMLLLLARARVADRRAGLRDEESGWLYTLDVARQLNTSVEALNVDVHRARRAVNQLGLLDDPASIVERRRSTGEIRLGIGEISL